MGKDAWDVVRGILLGAGVAGVVGGLVSTDEGLEEVAGVAGNIVVALLSVLIEAAVAVIC